MISETDQNVFSEGSETSLVYVSYRRYEEDLYWRRLEDEQFYWVEQRRRMAPPPLMGRPSMPVPPLLVSCNVSQVEVHDTNVANSF